MRMLIGLLTVMITQRSACAQSTIVSEDALFESKIRPIFAEHCHKCHGPKKTRGGLRLDSRAALMRGGDGGTIIVPGQPEKSRLIQALRHIDGADLRMPPDKKLPEHVIADFTAWVKRGAVWPAERSPAATETVAKHWAFQPVRKPPAPHDPTGWAANPIDCFIAAKWNEQGLRPVAPADARTLLRRLYFDLIGLPPTVE